VASRSPRAVHLRQAPDAHALLRACEVDDAGDGGLLLVAAGGGVALLHLLGEGSSRSDNTDQV
jgi:hypothetical protein